MASVMLIVTEISSAISVTNKSGVRFTVDFVLAWIWQSRQAKCEFCFSLIPYSSIMSRHYKWYLCLLPFVLFVVWLVWPIKSLFPDSYSRVIYDANGQLLRATLADDEQLRFAVTTDSLPGKYVAAVTT